MFTSHKKEEEEERKESAWIRRMGQRHIQSYRQIRVVHLVQIFGRRAEWYYYHFFNNAFVHIDDSPLGISALQILFRFQI